MSVRHRAATAHIITIIDSTIAAAMISTWSGRARPTAVNTESSENTISISAICVTTATKAAACRSSARRRGAPPSVS